MDKSKQHLVVLTGAGISAESGLKTFRDADGLWMGYNIYEVASPAGFKANPSLVLDFYNMRRKDVANAVPNAAHIGLVELEKDFKVTIITQNIDDLHERAGSTNVLHLHGEIFKMRSVRSASKIYDILDNILPGDLAEDGGQLRPHIVWFDEQVTKIPEAQLIVSTADIFVVVGTSLQVYPAAGLLNYAQPGVPIYVIDKTNPLAYSNRNSHFMEMAATQGVKVLANILALS
ncbi:MAG: NAD-dependent deacylase [Ginsengibacter sp.]